MNAAIKKLLQPSAPMARARTSLVENLERMLEEAGPGEILRLSCADGRPFALIDYEDLTHLLERAGCWVQGEAGSSL